MLKGLSFFLLVWAIWENEKNSQKIENSRYIINMRIELLSTGLGHLGKRKKKQSKIR